MWQPLMAGEQRGLCMQRLSLLTYSSCSSSVPVDPSSSLSQLFPLPMVIAPSLPLRHFSRVIWNLTTRRCAVAGTSGQAESEIRLGSAQLARRSGA